MTPEFTELLTSRVGLSAEAVRAAAARARAEGDTLASAALKAGLLDARSLCALLASHTGFPAVDLSACVIPASCADTVPLELARKHCLVVVSATEQQLVVAMREPWDLKLVDELRFRTGRRILPHVAIPSVIREVVAALYAMRGRPDVAYRGSDAPPSLRDVGHVAVVLAGDLKPGLEKRRARAKGGAASELPELDAPRQTRPRKARGYGPLLIVDDDPDMLELAALCLRRLDIPIVEASNGSRAVALALQERPRLILLDAMLPGMHGFEVCRELKATAETKDIPIVLCSAIYSDWRIHEDARKSLGAEAFLSKPFQMEVLSKLIRDLLFGTISLEAPGAGQGEAQQGRLALQQGDAARAVELLTAATRAQPLWPEAHFYLGLAQEEAGQPYEAVSAHERAVELKPELFVCLVRLAELYERIGFQHSALGTWERALEHCPTTRERDRIKQRLTGLLEPTGS